MSLVTIGGNAASIVPFDPTFGITVVATVMLALFVLAMVFPAVAPFVSSTWTQQGESTSSHRSAAEANGGETTEADPDGAAAREAEPDETGSSEAEAHEAAADETEVREAETGAGSASMDRDRVREDMSGTFTNDEIGKLVERADGKVIGTVASVRGETAHVEPKPDALDQILIRLDRKEMGEPFDLDADSVREISDTRIHLERDFSEPTARSTANNEDSVSSAKQ